MPTSISYADESWPIVTGCSRTISPGCDHCWAARLAATRLKHHPRYAGLAARSTDGEYGWTTNMVRLHPDLLDVPLRWRRPRTVFACPTGDLFHDEVPRPVQVRVYALASVTARHRYLVLTKRPWNIPAGWDWPANVWLGVSISNQDDADRLLPLLLKANAAHKWVSAEPLLGPLDLTPWLDRIGWVVAGCESGPRRRPTERDWFIGLRDQCRAHNVPYYLKQMDVVGMVLQHPTLELERYGEVPWQL